MEAVANEEFRAEWKKLAMIVQALDGVDLKRLRDTVEQADTVGPILFPTEYRAGMKNLQNQRRVLEAATILQRTFAAVLKSEIGTSRQREGEESG